MKNYVANVSLYQPLDVLVVQSFALLSM